MRPLPFYNVAFSLCRDLMESPAGSLTSPAPANLNPAGPTTCPEMPWMDKHLPCITNMDQPEHSPNTKLSQTSDDYVKTMENTDVIEFKLSLNSSLKLKPVKNQPRTCKPIKNTRSTKTSSTDFTDDLEHIRELKPKFKKSKPKPNLKKFRQLKIEFDSDNVVKTKPKPKPKLDTQPTSPQCPDVSKGALNQTWRDWPDPNLTNWRDSRKACPEPSSSLDQDLQSWPLEFAEPDPDADWPEWPDGLTSWPDLGDCHDSCSDYKPDLSRDKRDWHEGELAWPDHEPDWPEWPEGSTPLPDLRKADWPDCAWNTRFMNDPWPKAYLWGYLLGLDS